MLDAEVEVYLTGGGALTLQGLKNATKEDLTAEVDIDAALEWLQRVERLEVADDGSLVPIGRET